MPKYRVYKPKELTMLPAEQIVPVHPKPVFRSNTSHVRVVQGGFMDDGRTWHEAPKRIKEAVRVHGNWYWVFSMRDRKGKWLLSKSLLFPSMQDYL